MSGKAGAHIIKRLAFENGEELREVRVGYAKHGTLNAARDNAVLLVPGYAVMQTHIPAFLDGLSKKS